MEANSHSALCRRLCRRRYCLPTQGLASVQAPSGEWSHLLAGLHRCSAHAARGGGPGAAELALAERQASHSAASCSRAAWGPSTARWEGLTQALQPTRFAWQPRACLHSAASGALQHNLRSTAGGVLPGARTWAGAALRRADLVTASAGAAAACSAAARAAQGVPRSVLAARISPRCTAARGGHRGFSAAAAAAAARVAHPPAARACLERAACPGLWTGFAAAAASAGRRACSGSACAVPELPQWVRARMASVPALPEGARPAHIQHNA